MFEDLDLLATRVRQLTELTQSLRAENAQLAKALAQRDAHILQLRETLTSAQARLDGVVARLGSQAPQSGPDNLPGLEPPSLTS